MGQTDTEGGTHRTERLTNIDMAGWVDGSFRKYYHFVAPSCKLELARFLGGDALDGKTNKHLATTDRHRGGDAPDGKTKKH